MQSDSLDRPGATGKTLRDAEFDRKVIPYWRWLVSIILAVTIVGIPLIPFWLLYSLWFAPKYLGRLSARLTDAGAGNSQGRVQPQRVHDSA